jgi:hypothetical protein
MKRRSILLIATILMLLTGCEKEIDMDYHTVASQYVVEGSVTQNGTDVKVSRTRDIEDNNRQNSFVENAVAVITSDWGLRDTLRYRGNGRYMSEIKGMFGQTYTLDVEINGQHYSSSSQMQRVPVVNKCRLVWKRVMSTDILFLEVELQDTPSENNYYFIHIYRNEVGFRWAVMDDTKNPGGELLQLFSCGSRDNVEDASNSDAIHASDRLRVEMRSMDKLSYNYLFSMQQMNSSGTNPIDNFTGGCLGFFSAYGVITHSFTVNLGNIPFEED